jgi:hypothetical protein
MAPRLPVYFTDSRPAGSAEPNATEFEVSATLGPQVYGILSNPFLDSAFQTVTFRVRVTVNDDGTWSYEEHTALRLPDRQDLVDHIDRDTLRRIGDPDTEPASESTRPPQQCVNAADTGVRTWARDPPARAPPVRPNRMAQGRRQRGGGYRQAHR